jgi:hypothetical protein
MTITYTVPSAVRNDLDRLDTYSMGGSRSMAQRPDKEDFSPAAMIGSKITETTDWDFATPDNENSHKVLLEAGFTYFAPETLDYRDDLTTGIYQKTYRTKFDMLNPLSWLDESPVVQVSLRSDYHLFCQVWNSIDPEFYYKFIWKRGPNNMFQELSLTKESIRDILNQLFRTARYMI